MPRAPKIVVDLPLMREWTLTPAATLGSSVRAKGILLEIRAKLPVTVRRSLDIKGAILALRMAEDAQGPFDATIRIVEQTLDGIENLPIIPREIEDILAIKTSERHRWLKDGRLVSAGTRTVKLRGRARQITFHVFDPRHVEDILNRDLVDVWREDDVLTAAENRRLAVLKARIRREEARLVKTPLSPDAGRDEAGVKLRGWDEFEREGLLR
ncbi:hypothetical protein [Devosia rhizoryzae]|uniref:Uncharacterized protein n=1 Tax=Devosia rhizoryzae TaxID=2774137 RepID=A0ABX7C9A5_9HYPH|nr:hypothetical protein [Devosia rhizoryzae]QQR38546.1 hypothetical protein JI748_12280 [Devosia rhizoryzae]